MALKVQLLRPDDLLNLQIECVKLQLDTSNHLEPVLIPIEPSQDCYLVVTFPPQTIAERAYFEAAIVPSKDNPNQEVAVQPDDDPKQPDPEAASETIEPLDPPGHVDNKRPTGAQLGHPSRLVFKVPAEARIPFSIEGLLDWSNLELNINPIAAIGPNPSQEQIANAPATQKPMSNETALERAVQAWVRKQEQEETSDDLE